MSDLIDREYAIKRFCEDGTYLERHGVGMMTLCEAKQRAVDLIESFPSAQPVNYGSTKSDSSSQLKLNNDLISRQAAIDALDKHIDTFDAIDTNYLCGLRTAMSILKEMPSAQPEMHDKRTETHECDLINRQQAIDAVVSAMIDGADAELVEGVMELLPSAQPERKKGKWITVLGRLGNEVECNQCHSVFWYWMGNYRFCPSCGARMDGESDE